MTIPLSNIFTIDSAQFVENQDAKPLKTMLKKILFYDYNI